MSPDDRCSVHLRRAGSHLVAAVYALQGGTVSWPLEPATYDMLVELAEDRSCGCR